jgi:zinc/manganese transport system permease protein
VSPSHITKTAVLYAVIGVAHFLLRRPFFEITNDPMSARQRGRKIFFWDFLFYAMFGFVVTSSVQIAGVLLVFGFLVIPAVAGLMATEKPGWALTIGWIFGFAGSLAGLVLSVQLDLPAAPTILVSLTVVLAILGAGLRLRTIGRTRLDRRAGH